MEFRLHPFSTTMQIYISIPCLRNVWEKPFSILNRSRIQITLALITEVAPKMHQNLISLIPLNNCYPEIPRNTANKWFSTDPKSEFLQLGEAVSGKEWKKKHWNPRNENPRTRHDLTDTCLLSYFRANHSIYQLFPLRLVYSRAEITIDFLSFFTSSFRPRTLPDLHSYTEYKPVCVNAEKSATFLVISYSSRFFQTSTPVTHVTPKEIDIYWATKRSG